jgi:hypothetical protein
LLTMYVMVPIIHWFSVYFNAFLLYAIVELLSAVYHTLLS